MRILFSTRDSWEQKFNRDWMIKRRERILFSFTSQENKNPVTKKSVLDALKNIDKQLSK